MINKVILIGNVGADPKVKVFDSGGKAVNISLATTEKYKDRNGQKQEETQWHNVSFFGKTAGVVEEYVKKGDRLYIEGKVTYRKYTDKEGTERYITDIKAFQLTMLGGGAKQPMEEFKPAPVPSEKQEDEEDDLPF